jgi:hypothetical protein
MRARILLALPLVAACAELRPAAPADAPVVEAAQPAPAAPPARGDAPDPAPPAPPPPADANTAEELDTTSDEDRAAALAPPEAAPAGSLGTTTATLGPPGDTGIWVETPLVTAVTPGRVVYGANGNSVNVELRPSGGEPGSGSQISLAAIRLLEAPLTGILELQIFSG